MIMFCLLQQNCGQHILITHVLSPSHAKAPLRPKDKDAGMLVLRKPSKPCDVGIHWKALAEYSQMSTHLPGFRSFFSVFASFLFWTNKPPEAEGLATPLTSFKFLAVRPILIESDFVFTCS